MEMKWKINELYICLSALKINAEILAEKKLAFFMVCCSIKFKRMENNELRSIFEKLI